MRDIKVYGDYGYTSECLLYETDSISAATQWAEGYIDRGDFGGYNMIEVAEFADDGEYIVHRLWEQDLFDAEDDVFLFDEC